MCLHDLQRCLMEVLQSIIDNSFPCRRQGHWEGVGGGGGGRRGGGGRYFFFNLLFNQVMTDFGQSIFGLFCRPILAIPFQWFGQFGEPIQFWADPYFVMCFFKDKISETTRDHRCRSAPNTSPNIGTSPSAPTGQGGIT